MFVKRQQLMTFFEERETSKGESLLKRPGFPRTDPRILAPRW
jgi:hypothetical protein